MRSVGAAAMKSEHSGVLGHFNRESKMIGFSIIVLLTSKSLLAGLHKSMGDVPPIVKKTLSAQSAVEMSSTRAWGHSET